MNTDSVLRVLFELLAKSILISLVAALLARTWRGATAAQRHLLWLVALATVMLLPITRLISPRWAIPVQSTKQITVVALPPDSVTKPDTALAPDDTIVSPPTSTPLDWHKILFGIWLGGAALLLGYRLFGSWRLHRLLRRSVSQDDPRIRLLTSRVLSELGLSRRLEIRLSEECRVPITWGSLRPVVLLPTAALGWNDVWLTAALRHEAAHIARHDYFTRWLAQVACALYWPNPLVWLVARSLRLAQEQAADDLVLRAGTPADEYATQLVHAARAVAAHGLFVRQAVAMACPSTLEDRVRSIVDGHRDRRPLSRFAASVGSIIILLTLAISTAAQLRGADPAAPAADKGTGPAVAKGPQVVILARIVAVPKSLIKPGGPLSEAAINRVYAEPETEALIRLLNQKKGVDLHAAPEVATRPGQAATIEIIREFRYATEWTKGARTWEPKTETTKSVGLSIEVTPGIKDGGNIELHVKPSLTEFEGYRDLDAPGKFPATNLQGKRVMPAFSEGKLDTTVTLKSGETAAISWIKMLLDGKPVGEEPERPRTIMFITARIQQPGDSVFSGAITGNLTLNGVIADGAAKPAATPAGDAPKTLTKTETGTLTLSGSTENNTYTGVTTISGVIVSSTEPAPASNATVRLMPNGEQVELTGQSVTTDKDGVATVKGDARLKWAGQDMSAESIRYHPSTRQVELFGKVRIRNSVNLIEADHLTVWLEDQHPGGHINISGPHKTTVEPTPAARPSPKP